MKKVNHIHKEIQKLNRLLNLRGMNYPSKIDDWKMFEKNNPTIAFNILYIKEKEIYPAYISKHNP